MNFFDYLNKLLIDQPTLKSSIDISAVEGRAGESVFTGDNSSTINIDNSAIFSQLSSEELNNLDYKKILGYVQSASNSQTDNTKLKPAEFVLKEFLSIDKIKQAADINGDGNITEAELKEYVINLSKQDNDESTLSLNDFEKVLTQNNIVLDKDNKTETPTISSELYNKALEDKNFPQNVKDEITQNLSQLEELEHKLADINNELDKIYAHESEILRVQTNIDNANSRIGRLSLNYRMKKITQDAYNDAVANEQQNIRELEQEITELKQNRTEDSVRKDLETQKQNLTEQKVELERQKTNIEQKITNYYEEQTIMNINRLPQDFRITNGVKKTRLPNGEEIICCKYSFFDKCQPELLNQIQIMNQVAKDLGYTLVFGDMQRSKQISDTAHNNYAIEHPGEKNPIAPGGMSPHNYGCAVDIVLFKNGRLIDSSSTEQRIFAKEVMKRCTGLFWGGDYNDRELGEMERHHFELRNWKRYKTSGNLIP